MIDLDAGNARCSASRPASVTAVPSTHNSSIPSDRKMLEPFVCHGGLDKVQELELLEPSQVYQARVGDTSPPSLRIFSRFSFGQLSQPCVADRRVARLNSSRFRRPARKNIPASPRESRRERVHGAEAIATDAEDLHRRPWFREVQGFPALTSRRDGNRSIRDRRAIQVEPPQACDLSNIARSPSETRTPSRLTTERL